jgi:hypothetical protein
MALDELKQKYKDEPDVLKRIETIENQAYSVGQADNIDVDYAERVAQGQSLMSGGGKIWYEDAEGNKLRDVEVTPTKTSPSSSSSSSSRVSSRQPSVTYDDMYKRAQEIVNPRVKSMMEQIESAMLRSREATAQNLAARGQATGGVRQSAEQALTAEEMLSKQAAAREGEAQTAELAQDMYTQERGFEMQEQQLSEQQRQFDEQMELALKQHDYQKIRDIVNDEKWMQEFGLKEEQFEWNQDTWKQQFQYEVEQNRIGNYFQQQGLDLQKAQVQETVRYHNMTHSVQLAQMAQRAAEAEQNKKNTLASQMEEFEKHYPAIAATDNEQGREAAYRRISGLQEGGAISEETSNRMVEALTKPTEKGYEMEDVQPMIEAQFLEGDKGEQKIENTEEFIDWLVGMSPYLAPGEMDKIQRTNQISDESITKYLKDRNIDPNNLPQAQGPYTGRTSSR